MPETANSNNCSPVKMLFQKIIEFNNSSILVTQLQSDFFDNRKYVFVAGKINPDEYNSANSCDLFYPNITEYIGDREKQELEKILRREKLEGEIYYGFKI